MTTYDTELIDDLTEHPSGAEMKGGDRAAIARGNSPPRANKATFPTDYSIGRRAFQNPPNDLSDAQKAAVRAAFDLPDHVSGLQKATNTDVDNETDDSKYTTVMKVYRAIDRRVKNASQTVRGIVLLARNDDIDNETDLTRIPTLAGAIRLWRRLRTELREVPSTPGDQTGIGHILTVFGEGDKDYNWRSLNDAIAAYLQANPIASQRVLVDVPASDDTVDKIIIEDSQLYTTRDRVVHEATPKRATYENIRFDLGYFSDESALDARFYTVGRFYYNFAKYTPRVVAYVAGNSGPKHWVDGNAADLVANITADVGHFASDAEATPHVNGVGNVYYNERIRAYRRVATFEAGRGPVTAKQRLRQANEDDLARLDDEIALRGTRMQASPQVVNKDDVADEYTFTLWTIPGYYNTATMARIKFLTDAAEGTILRPYDPQMPVHRFTIELDDDQKRMARQASPGNTEFATIDLLDNEGAVLPRWDIPGVVQGQAFVVLTVVPGPRIGTRQMADAIEDVEHRASDLRVVGPPGWETAVGTGVGISLTRAIVADVASLSYNASVSIPADAEAGDDYIIYMAVPTGSNLSDWRVDLAGFAQYPGFNFGEVGTDGDNTVYSYLFTVGDDSGGFASGTAPGARLTLQHHGTTPHTAYSGELEGRALEQVQAQGGGRSDNLQPAVNGGDTAGVAQITLPSDYADYRTLSVTLWRTSVDRIDPLEIATKFLAAQTENQSIYTDDAVIGWNPTTRVLSTPNQRIIYAELHDGSAAAASSGDGGSYTLPQATETILGGVRGASVAQAGQSSGRTFLAWSLDRLKLVIRANIPAATTSQRGGGQVVTQAQVDADSSTSAFLWGLANLKRYIRAQLPSWAVRDDVSTIPAGKLGSGARTGAKFLRDDGTWQEIEAGGLTQVQQIGLLKFSPESPTFQFVQNSELSGKTFNVLVDNPQLLTGDIWYERRLGANLVPGGRTKWTNTTFSIGFPVPSNPGVQGLLANALTGDGLTLELRFYDAHTGGNVVDLIRETVGGAHAFEPAPVATLDLYNAVNPKLPNRIYYWPNHQKDGKDVPGGIAVGDNILSRNERLTADQVELLLRRVPNAIYEMPDSGVLTWDLDEGYIASVTLGGAPRNFQPLVHPQIGDHLILRVVQDATGGRTIAWHGNYKFIGGPVTLNSGANEETYLSLTVIAANHVLVGYLHKNATSPAEATAIADTQAAARYTDAEKAKLANLGRVFVPRGTFRQRTAYSINDVVIYSGHLYYVAQAVPATNTANPVDGLTWILLSADPTPTATETRQGTVELSTQAEMNAGTAGKVPDAAKVKAYADTKLKHQRVASEAAYDALQNKDANTLYYWPE